MATNPESNVRSAPCPKCGEQVMCIPPTTFTKCPHCSAMIISLADSTTNPAGLKWVLSAFNPIGDELDQLGTGTPGWQHSSNGGPFAAVGGKDGPENPNAEGWPEIGIPVGGTVDQPEQPTLRDQFALEYVRLTTACMKPPVPYLLSAEQMQSMTPQQKIDHAAALMARQAYVFADAMLAARKGGA